MGQFGIDKLYATIVTTQTGGVPCAGENGELGKYALLSDIPKYYKVLKNQIDSICITGEFTPVTTTANISGFIVNELLNKKEELSENITVLEKELSETKTKIELIKEDSKKLNIDFNEKLKTHNSDITRLLQNYTTLVETKDNSEITQQKINEINNQINLLKNNYNSFIHQSENITKLVNILETTNNDTVEQVKTIKSDVDKLINQNKEIMRFMLSIKTKLSGF